MQVKYSHFALLLFLHHSCLCLTLATAETNLTTDQLALLALKARITSDHPHGGLIQNWTISSPVCNWIGVICGNHHHRVTELNISDMGLTGSIPPEVGNLSFLVSMDLGNNSFGGTLPEDLARLRKLKYISLDNNNFMGDVPSWFPSLPLLQNLSLQNNNFTSLNSFVLSNESKLAYLNLARNPFHSEIPKSIGKNLHNLRSLVMEGNGFSGLIPPSIVNMSSLEVLQLGNNSLQGTIPEAIGSLPHLSHLRLRYNQLTGSIPSSIFNMSTLEFILLEHNNLTGLDDMCTLLPKLEMLRLDENKVRGTLPSNFSSCPKLQMLLLSNNFFSGPIPHFIGNLESLEVLSIRGNKLTGKIPPTIGNFSNLVILGLSLNKLEGELPSSICNLSSLKILDLSTNGLEGILPDCLGSFSVGLDVLYLHENGFHGSIPQTFKKGCAMKIFMLRDNQLEGSLPQALANCTQLKVLDIGNNKIRDYFPSWLERLSELRIFSIRFNRFHGRIRDPKKEIPFTKLILFDISNNDFTGSLPTMYFKNFGELSGMGRNKSDEKGFSYIEANYSGQWGNITAMTPVTVNLKGVPIGFYRVATTFNMIDLSNNKFNGTIPFSFGNFTALRLLNLSHNNLTGHIPTTLRFLTALEMLDLSSNHLEGQIPRQLGSLTSLSRFNVSYNNLSGEIPQSGGQFQTFDNDSYIGNFELCGHPLTKKCKEPATPPSVIPQERKYESMFDGITWQGVLMGYGFGAIVGVVMGLLYF